MSSCFDNGFSIALTLVSPAPLLRKWKSTACPMHIAALLVLEKQRAGQIESVSVLRTKCQCYFSDFQIIQVYFQWGFCVCCSLLNIQNTPLFVLSTSTGPLFSHKSLILYQDFILFKILIAFLTIVCPFHHVKCFVIIFCLIFLTVNYLLLCPEQYVF